MRVCRRCTRQISKGNKKLEEEQKTNEKKETKDKTQIAHTINKVNCTQMNQPNHPKNPTINLYTGFTCSSRLFVPRIVSRPQLFTPRRIGAWNPFWWCNIVLGARLTRIQLNALEALTKLLTHKNGKQAFTITVSPQKVAPSSACLKGILVIFDS